MFAIPFGAASGSEIKVQLLRKKTLFSQKLQESVTKSNNTELLLEAIS